MSGAMTRKRSASEGITSRQLTHALTPGPEPWIISTGEPAPRSWQLVAMPPASTVRAISGLDVDTSFMRVLLELHHDVAKPRRPPNARSFEARFASGKHREKVFVELAIVVEDRPAELVVGPGERGLVRVVDVAAGEHLVAVTGGIEEIDGLAPGDAVARRTDVERDAPFRNDVRGLQHLAPVVKHERRVMELVLHRLPDEGHIVRLVGAGQEGADQHLVGSGHDPFGDVEAQHLGEQLDCAIE